MAANHLTRQGEDQKVAETRQPRKRSQWLGSRRLKSFQVPDICHSFSLQYSTISRSLPLMID